QGNVNIDGNPTPVTTPATLTLTGCTVDGNSAVGGTGGAGGDGGDGLGGGMYHGNVGLDATLRPIVWMSNTAVTDNRAVGGAAGSGGSAGQGIGGGVYTLGDFYADVVSVIRHNDASTSYDDVFGDLIPW